MDLTPNQLFSQLLVQNFEAVKKHFEECPKFQNVLLAGIAEDEAEDLFEDEDAAQQFLFDHAEDDSDEEESGSGSEDEDIEEEDSEDEPVKPQKKQPLPASKKSKGAPSTNAEKKAQTSSASAPSKKKLPATPGVVLKKSQLTPSTDSKKDAASKPLREKNVEARNTPVAAKKRSQPDSDSMVKKANLKGEKSLEPSAKKSKLDEDSSEVDSDEEESPKQKGFWKGKVGGGEQKQAAHKERGGFNQRGGRGNFGNDRGGRFNQSPRGGSFNRGGNRGGNFNRGGNRSSFGGNRGGDRGNFGGNRGGNRGGRGGGNRSSWPGKQNQSGGTFKGKRTTFDD